VAGDEGGVSHAHILRSIEELGRRMDDGLNRVHDRVDQTNEGMASVRQETARCSEAITHLATGLDKGERAREALRADLNKLQKPVQTAQIIVWCVGGLFGLLITIIGIIPGVRALVGMFRGDA
jgi:hypothetical protein